MKNIAIILAAGIGSRFGSNIPKQFITLANSPVLIHAVSAFSKIVAIDEIIVVTSLPYFSLTKKIIFQSNINKNINIIVGSATRYLSTWQAIQSINYDECNILIHDAVRPLVSATIIESSIAALSNFEAVNVILPVVDTVFQLENNSNIKPLIRDNLYCAQTPQSFKKSKITLAYQQFLINSNNVTIPTDDCSLLLQAFPKTKIYFVKGETKNFKITHPQDLLLAECMIASSF